MKNFWIGFLMFGFQQVTAQIYVKHEFFASSEIKNQHNEPLTDDRPLNVSELGATVPLYLQKYENQEVKRATLLSFIGTYAGLSNRRNEQHLVKEVSNYSFGMIHIEPLSKRFQLMASAGGGVASTVFRKVKIRDAFFQLGAMGIYRPSDHQTYGVGFSLSNTYNEIQLLPTFILEWKMPNDYYLNALFYASLDMEFGKKFSDKIKLGVALEEKVILAKAENQQKEVGFTTQYGFLGGKLTYSPAKNWSIPLSAGLGFSRSTYYDCPTFNVFIDVLNKNRLSPYIALGIFYGK